MLADQSIPWAKPIFWGRERDYVTDALASTWISGGSYLDRLEREIATFCDVPHALAVANGTMAIHLAYLAIGLKAGDEVVVPGFAFLAAANVALHMGAKPVFAEVDPSTWCVTAEAIERVLTARTRAVVPVHTYGNACDMDPIIALCRSRGIWLIEDAAESFATRYKGRQTGGLADIGCLSFQATKTITTGEGGMTLTNRGELVERMRLYRSHGMLRTRYMHEIAGLNFRLTNIQAALGCAQFERLDAITEARRRMIANYRARLDSEAGLKLQSFSPDVDPVPWSIGVKLEARAFPQGRDSVMQQMTLNGIETRPGFYAASTMPHLYGPVCVPICQDIGGQIVNLPSFPSITEGEIDRVCDALTAQRN